MTPAELCAGLDRDVAAAVGDAAALLSIHVDRRGDDAFEIMVMVNITPTPKSQRQVGSWKKQELDLAAVRAIIAWAGTKYGAARATFSHWKGWTGSHEKNARELARVFEATPSRVIVSRGMPTSERGEPATGQPSLTLTLDARGLEIEAPLYWTYTAEDNHAQRLAELQEAGEALATALGVRCKVM